MARFREQISLTLLSHNTTAGQSINIMMNTLTGCCFMLLITWLVIFSRFHGIYCNLQSTSSLANSTKDANPVHHNMNHTQNASSHSRVLYKQMLKGKRREQLAAVKRILQYEDYKKQEKTIQLLLEQLHKVVKKSKSVLESALYNAEDPFPEDEAVRDALAHVVENTAFFGDILLHHPDITHEFLKKNKDWLDLFHWSIRFANSTDLYDHKTMEMISLAAQELNIVERDPNYVNPYKKVYSKVTTPSPKPKVEKKKKVFISKGPKLTHHIEL